MSYKVDAPTKIKLHPYAECLKDVEEGAAGCPWMAHHGPDARDRAKQHVRDTGHSVLVVVEERTLYSPRGAGMKYGPLPIGWHLTAEHVNSEGERMGIASCHDHPQFGDARLLIVWDAPIPLGTGVAAMTLIDTGVIEWLQEVLAL